jgi:gamma-glutamylputrescine oxidase
MAEDAKRNLHEVAQDNGFDFDYASGQLTPMHKKRYEAHEKAHIDAVNSRYGYDELHWLEPDEMAKRLGSSHYYGGSYDSGTGHFHPLKYLVGLAKAAAKAGAQLHENTRALAVKSNGKIMVKTGQGTITADQCLLALNGYHLDLENKTARHVMPIQSFMGATEPLLDDTAVLPGGEAVDDSRFVVRYFRKSKDNRLLFGGREIYSSSGHGDITAAIRRQITEIYPALIDVPITHAWGGSVAITMQRMPYIREVEPGLWSAGGYSGHGAMLSNHTGRLIAEKFLGGSEQLDILSRLKISPFPGGKLMRNPLLFLAMTWYSLLDRI